MSPPVDHQHPCHQDDHELLLDADEILCGGFRSDTVNNRVLLRASLRPELRCKCGDKSQTLRGWCTSVNHSTSRKSCRRERYDKQTRGAATETTATTDSQDIPFQYHDDTSRYIQVYREQRLAAMTADDAIYSSNHVASSMAFSWPFLATYYKHSEWPHKTKLTKIMPARRQKTKLATIPNRMTVPVKECNVLEGLPKKTFLLCAEHMAIMNDALRKSKEAPGYNRNGDSTDRKQASGTNDTDNSLESIEQDDDINTSLVPIPVFMLPNMTRGTTIVPPKLGVDGRKILSSDDTDANVKKMTKRREPKQLCCFQQHYMDLSLPKLKPSWSNTQPLEKVLKHRLRKRHILRVASLPTRACASTSTFDDGNVSLLYRKQGRSNTEYRLAGSCNTDTNDLKRSIVLSKLSTSRNLTMKENVAHISKCELFTSNNM